MATYIPNVTDYIPELQLFKPDLNFYAKTLQTKEDQYDQGYNQLSSEYGTLLNSRLTGPDNIKARDEYFKAANENIKKITGLDLSLRQNVQTASKVFAPLWEDQNIMKDMGWTKNNDNQIAKGESYKGCIDSEKCGGAWWEDGIKYLKYKSDEFAKATPEERMQMTNTSYTPYINIAAKADKLASDRKYSIKTD
jgi:hypothetical protein